MGTRLKIIYWASSIVAAIFQGLFLLMVLRSAYYVWRTVSHFSRVTTI